MMPKMEPGRPPPPKAAVRSRPALGKGARGTRAWLPLLVMFVLLFPTPALSGEADCQRCRELEMAIRDIDEKRIVDSGVWIKKYDERNLEILKKDRKVFEIEELKLDFQEINYGLVNARTYIQQNRVDPAVKHYVKNLENYVTRSEKKIKEIQDKIDTKKIEIETINTNLEAIDGNLDALKISLNYYDREISRIRLLRSNCQKTCRKTAQDDTTPAAGEEKDGGETKPDDSEKPDDQTKPDDGKPAALPRHPAIEHHMGQIKRAIAHAQAGIAECDRKKYEIGLTAARGHLQTLPAVNLRHLSGVEFNQQHALLLAALAEAKALVAAIPPYPDPCDETNIYYPELEYIIELSVIKSTFLWPHYICDVQKLREFYDAYFAVDPALEAMRAAAVSLAVGEAKPGTEEYERRITQGRLGILIRSIDAFHVPFRKHRYKKSDVNLKPDIHCYPAAQSVNRARMPTVMAWLKATGFGEFIPNRRAPHKGKTPVPLPTSVREAVIAAGLGIPPFSALPHDWE